jgi:integrase/recombinase XerD
MSDLREQFIDRMNLYGLSEHTKRGYVSSVLGLTKFYNQYFRYLLTERKLAWISCKKYLSGITYFYRHICNREVDDRFGLPPRPRGSKLPVVLSMEEVTRLLSCVKNLKHRVLLMTMYSAGLRAGETISLKPEHIESDPSRMVIRVDQGKGRKDRYSVLSEKLLKELREYWREYSPSHWLFPGQKTGSHITYESARAAFSNAKKSRHNQGMHSSHPAASCRLPDYAD